MKSCCGQVYDKEAKIDKMHNKVKNTLEHLYKFYEHFIVGSSNQNFDGLIVTSSGSNVDGNKGSLLLWEQKSV